MPYNYLLVLVTIVLLTATGCAHDDPDADAASSDTLQNNAELADMYEADQAARENIHEKLGDQEALREIFVSDSLRRVRAEELLDADAAQTADDYYHAAMIFQHGGDTTAYRRAHELSEKAVAIDSTHDSAKWLMAAAWDRYLGEKGEPQWYGTQYTLNGGVWRFAPVDTTQVTDAERLRLGIPPLAESRAYVDSLNASQ